MKNKPFALLLSLMLCGAFILACRTADLFSQSEPTPTRARVTRAAQRPTFTRIPTETETLVPTDTPEPTSTPEPTDEPTATRRPQTARLRPTQTAVPPTQTPKPQPTPTTAFDWVQNGNTSCTGGDGAQSVITGKITARNAGAVGQRVQASSGPGGEPVSDPNLSDKNGNYNVTLVCGGKACNGDFYFWMVDEQGRQLSPFVKFGFSDGCRKGTLNFIKR